MAQDLANASAAAQEYQEHAVLSQDPDYCGQLLYTAAVEACEAAQTADRNHDLAQWSFWVGRAQMIAASFWDAARSDSESAQLFKQYHLLIWAALNTALLQHDLEQLHIAHEALNECVRQINRRLKARASTTSVDVAW